MRRRKLNRSTSKRIFRASAGTHAKNVAPPPNRGGYRL